MEWRKLNIIDIKMGTLVVYKYIRECTSAGHKVTIYNLMSIADRFYDLQFSRKSITDTVNVITIVDPKVVVEHRGKFNYIYYSGSDCSEDI